MNLDEPNFGSGWAPRVQIRVESGQAPRVQLRAESGQVGWVHMAALI